MEFEVLEEDIVAGSPAEDEIWVLDHGFVRLVETWGSDERIVESARMSTNKGFLGWGPKADGKPGDEKLLRFLWDSRHSSPFEQAGATFEVQAPILVFREWHRHRTQAYTELSARYVQMPDLHYLPEAARVTRQSTTNKQASSQEPIAPEIVAEWLKRVEAEQKLIYDNYTWALEQGIAREIARINTPVSRYSRMRASANLRNWLHFLGLRTAPDAQYEIRVCANAVRDLLRVHFPRTLDLAFPLAVPV